MKRLASSGTPGKTRFRFVRVKSSRSFANGNCVELANLPNYEIGVRDSKDPEGPVLGFTPGEWRAFLGGVRNGEFDISARYDRYG
jgi:Domain of unknown function (DUF397)